MAEQPVHFDLKTIAILRETLDDAWDCLWPDERARTSRTILAESILKLAATGERDTERLLHAALHELTKLVCDEKSDLRISYS